MTPATQAELVQLNKGITAWDKIWGNVYEMGWKDGGTGRTGPNSAFLGLQQITAKVEELFTGKTDFSDKFNYGSNVEETRDFYSAVQVILPYYEAALVYTEAAGFPPDVAVEVFQTLLKTYADARGLGERYVRFSDHLLREEVYD